MRRAMSTVGKDDERKALSCPPLAKRRCNARSSSLLSARGWHTRLVLLLYLVCLATGQRNNTNSTNAPTRAPAPAPVRAPVRAPAPAPVLVTPAPPGNNGTDNNVTAPSRAPAAVASEPSATPTISPAPSAAPTKAPSDMPSDVPSRAPSATPTQAPTVHPTGAPTTEPRVQVNAPLVLQLSSVASLMLSENELALSQAVISFMTNELGDDYNHWNVSVDNQQLLPDSRRRLQARRRRLGTNNYRLYRRWLQDSSNNNASSVDLSTLEADLNVTAAARGANVSSDAFTIIMQDAMAANVSGFLAQLRTVDGLVNQIYFRPVERVVSVAAVSTPSPTPSPADGNDGLSTGAIAGIAVGGAVALVLVAGLLVYAQRKKGDTRSSSAYALHGGVNNAGGGPGTNTLDADNSTLPSKQETSASRRSRASGGNRVDDDEMSDANSALGTPSLMGTDYGADAMSYAYSLDAGGMENSVIGDESVARAPPLANMPSASGKAEWEAAAAAAAAGGAASTLDAASTTSSRKGSSPHKRQVVAPPGKLGIVIDTTLEGPVVHKVNDKSPLEGLLFPGDIIVAIDDVDTRAMSASAITALMVKTANQRRTLQVVSEEPA